LVVTVAQNAQIHVCKVRQVCEAFSTEYFARDVRTVARENQKLKKQPKKQPKNDLCKLFMFNDAWLAQQSCKKVRKVHKHCTMPFYRDFAPLSRDTLRNCATDFFSR
jgi:TorA maturation chaperone TorD